MGFLRFPGIVSAVEDSYLLHGYKPQRQFLFGANHAQNQLTWKLSALLTRLGYMFPQMGEPVLTLDEDGLVQAMWRSHATHLEVEITIDEIVWFAKDRLTGHSECVELAFNSSGVPNIHTKGLLNQIIYRTFLNFNVLTPAYYIYGISGNNCYNTAREVCAPMLPTAAHHGEVRAKYGRQERESALAFSV